MVEGLKFLLESHPITLKQMQRYKPVGGCSHSGHVKRVVCKESRNLDRSTQILVRRCWHTQMYKTRAMKAIIIFLIKVHNRLWDPTALISCAYEFNDCLGISCQSKTKSSNATIATVLKKTIVRPD